MKNLTQTSHEEPEKAELTTKLLEELFKATKTAQEIAVRIDPFVKEA